MCIVSRVTDYGQKLWPNPMDRWPNPEPFVPIGPIITPTPVGPGQIVVELTKFLELVEKARQLDELLGQKDCPDPAKEDWLKDVERRLALERAATTAGGQSPIVG